MSREAYAAAAGAAALALLLLAVVTQAAWLISIDTAVSAWAIALRSPALTTLMRGVTWLGSWPVYVALVLAGIPVARQRGVKYLVLAIVSLSLAQMVRLGLNLLVQRPRPPRSEWLVHANYYAFPSGHTLVAAVGFGLTAWLLWLADRRVGTLAIVITAAIPLLVGASRVYLGVHWPSDVAGSLALAAMWLGLTLLAARWLL